MAKRSSASDAARGFVPLELDGETYRLVYSFNAIADAESVCGVNLFHGISALTFLTFSAAQLRGLLYAALQEHHPHAPATKTARTTGVSLVQAGEMLSGDFETIRLITTKLREAYGVSISDDKQNPPEADDAPAES